MAERSIKEVVKEKYGQAAFEPSLAEVPVVERQPHQHRIAIVIIRIIVLRLRSHHLKSL